MADPAFLGRLEAWVAGQRTAGRVVRLSGYEPSAGLEKMASDLGIDVDQAPAAAIGLGSKASDRAILAAAGVPVARGTAEQHSVAGLARSMVPLVRDGVRGFMLKLSDSLWAGGVGLARLRLDGLGPDLPADDERLAADLLDALPAAEVAPVAGSWSEFAAAVPPSGVLAEELLTGEDLTCPSFQGVLGPHGPELNLRSTGVKPGFLLVTSLLGARPDAAGRLYRDGEERVYLASENYGKLGAVAVAPDLAECRRLHERLRNLLDELAARR